MIRSISALVLVALVGCAASADDAGATAGAASTTAATDLDMTETAGGQLDPFGCRHYMKLHLTGTAATLSPTLDSADPSDMYNGGCGGEELPANEDSKYPLAAADRTDCGASVFTGTIKWTTDGKVKRTLTLTDYRGSTCKDAPARVVAAITSTYQGETNPIATYYSVDGS